MISYMSPVCVCIIYISFLPSLSFSLLLLTPKHLFSNPCAEEMPRVSLGEMVRGRYRGRAGGKGDRLVWVFGELRRIAAIFPVPGVTSYSQHHFVAWQKSCQAGHRSATQPQSGPKKRHLCVTLGLKALPGRLQLDLKLPFNKEFCKIIPAESQCQVPVLS